MIIENGYIQEQITLKADGTPLIEDAVFVTEEGFILCTEDGYALDADEVGEPVGGIDPETGFPVELSTAWGDPIPCQWVISQKNLQAKSGSGEPIVRSSYVVYIEARELHSERIKLTDEWENELGEFSIISAEPLVAVGQLKITV